MKLLVLTVLLMACVFTSTATGKGGWNYSWASWYGPGLYGNHTACGQTLTGGTWGVAHKYMRCGTRLRMCYHGCVMVTVIDRGPYVGGRDFDLTYPVKRAIGMPGVGRVHWSYR